ncbi:MAG: DnaD domain protein [Oscillospiraceae bacterium]|nr:DnaD domain protein [Oscillospiraceae bacterium]
MNLFLNFNQIETNFSIPTKIVDKYINTIDYKYINILIYLLRNISNNISIENIEHFFKYKDIDYIIIIKFWIKENILPETILNGFETNSLDKNIINIKHFDNLEFEIGESIKSIDIEKNLELNNIQKETLSIDIKEIYNHIEQIISRPITYIEKTTITSILNSTHIKPDVLLMVFEYCIKINKMSIRYVKSICNDWDKKNIHTHELAEKYLKNIEESKSNHFNISKLFGINNRALSEWEKNYIDKWFTEFNFSQDIIKEAYNKTIDNIGKISFPYINKILTDWNLNNITSLSQILDIKPKIKSNKKTNVKKYNKNNISSFSEDVFDKLSETISKL